MIELVSSRKMRRLALAMAAFCCFGASAADQAAAQEVWALDTAAPYAIVVDVETGDVLMEKEAEKPFPPASLSKLMTAAMTFDALASGRLTLEDTFAVSEAAFRKEGSTMYLNLGDSPTVADLLRGVIIQSGNDASITLAEGIAGSERAFAERMTARARELGMSSSTFANATGLPNPDHRMTARDLATLALYIIGTHETYYPLYAETEFTWAGVTQKNRNPLLYVREAGDGMKTGHTEEAGYGIVGSAERDGRRVVAVLSGLPSAQARAREIQRVLSWAFREFRNVKLVSAGDIVGEAQVWLGASDTVPLAAAEDVVATLPYIQADDVSFKLRYEGPLEAPIEKGQAAGELVIQVKGMAPKTVPVVVAEPVAEGGFGVRLGAAFSLLMSSLLGGEKQQAETPAE